MPKMKSKGAVNKRFKLTKNGKLKSSRAGQGHYHATKSAAQKRGKRKALITEGTWAKLLKRMMSGG